MFTKADYIEYFEQIAAVEKDMMLKVQKAIKSIDDKDICATLKSVSEDEARHYAYVKELIDALELDMP
jgi:rubrerythrin